MSKARDLGDLLDTDGDVISGSLDNVPTPSKTSIEALGIALPAANLTGSIANARIPAGAVTQHVDLTPVHQSIATLGLHMGVSANAAAFNLPNAFIDTFEDDTGIATETTVGRSSSEYVGSVYSTVATTTPSSTSDWVGSTGTCSFGAGTVTHNSGDKAIRSSSVLSGDFEFTGTYTGGGSANGGWLGVFPTSEVDTFTSTHEHGGMRSMTNSYFLAYESRAYVTNGTNKGGSVQTTFNPATGAVFKITRVGSTITYYVDDVIKTTLTSQTTADMYTCVGSGGSGPRNYTGVSWQFGSTSANATGTLISDTQTAPAATTEVSGVILYKDNAGTATLGTHLKIYFTANNGTNWTEAASYGTAQTFSGTTKQVKLGKTTVTSGTQVAMKAVWASQASGSMETQLHGWAVNY
jgi:hypothetical protein